MADSWRCFVAVSLGEALRASLADAVRRWRDRPELANLRWTDSEAWHVTLAFLGAVPASSVDELASRLEVVAGAHEPMRLVSGGVGGFPSAARARIVWYGVADPDRRLTRLARDVDDAAGLDEGRRFRPHVTLARSRSGEIDLRPWLADAAAPEGELIADEVRLMRSHLARGPAWYETLRRVPLGRPARG